MLKLKAPKIIDGLAKFNGRKKKYIPYSDFLDKCSASKRIKIETYAVLQTKWEQLRLRISQEISGS